MTDALQKVTREIKAMSAEKYDITAQGEEKNVMKLIKLYSMFCWPIEKFVENMV